MDPDATHILTRNGENAESEPSPPWELEAHERLAQAVERFSVPLGDLVERGANEGDTQILVADFLGYALNYSKYGELTTEYRTSGGSVDYGILIDNELFAFVEVKPPNQRLDARNLQQSRIQATEKGVFWVVLTNGQTWQVYHLGDETTSGTQRILNVDLLDQENRTAAVDLLFHLTKEAVQHGRLTELRAWREALAPASLAGALQSEAVINAVRTELRGRTGHQGHMGDVDELSRILGDEVIARNVAR